MKNIKKVLDKPLKERGLFVDSVSYKDKTLYITLDSDSVIDLDRITDASRLINSILDENDFFKESYTLDISSKEKGEK